MNFRIAICTVSLLICVSSVQAEDARTHLLILSGQSNMQGLDPAVSFTPTVQAALPGDEVIVVKDAQGGQPIRRWYRDWRADPAGAIPEGNGDLYVRLMNKVEVAAKEKQIDTITFVWMQGERDAKTGFGDVYAASLAGLVKQLRDDLQRPDVGFVIGRLSDHAPGENALGWDTVREAQVAVAEADRRGAWVDTDDLNGNNNGLHYTREGYKTLGERFAHESLKLIGQANK